MRLYDRLMVSIDTSAGPDACHPWTGSKVGMGYGKTKVEGRTRRVTRVLAELAGWDIEGRVLRHVVCANPPCCNLRHLAAGSNADNTADMQRDGRTARGAQHGRHTQPGATARGARHGMAKLTPEQVQQIRELYAAGGISQRALAARFAVSQAAIWGILAERNWAE